MQLRIEELDPESRKYLEGIWQSKGANTPGIFAFLGEPVAERTPAGWIATGVLLLVMAGIFLAAPVGFVEVSVGKAGLATVGFFLAAYGWHLHRTGRGKPSTLGNFIFVDGLHLWRVRSHEVRTIRLAEVHRVSGQTYVVGSTPQHTELVFHTGNRVEKLRLNDDRAASRIGQFVNLMIQLRNSANLEEMPALAHPKVFTAVAQNIFDGNSRIDISDLDLDTEIAYPCRVDPPPDNRPSAALPVLCSVAFGILAVLLIPWIDSRNYEKQLYETAKKQRENRIAALEHYLREFPQGRFADEANDLLDDDTFALHAASARAGSPEQLENYLRKYPNGKHAAAAREMIDDLTYAAALARASGGHLADLVQYRRRFPTGKHYAEAEDAYLRAAENMADNGMLKGLESYRVDFPKGRYLGRVEDKYFAAGSNMAERRNVSGLVDYRANYPHGRYRQAADDRIYEVLSASRAIYDLEMYLHWVPDGSHVQEARDLCDDLRFASAKEAAMVRKSPSPLRGYLSNGDNRRHREEALKMVAAYYDAAIERIRELAKGKENERDAELFAAFLDLLEALKKTDSPIVMYRFRATQDPLPVSDLQKNVEKAAYDIWLKQEPELQALRVGSGDRAAVLPLGQVFDAGQTRRREDLIARKLSAAIAKICNPDLIQLVSAADESAAIELEYHTFATGGYYLYIRTDRPLADPCGDDPKGKIAGLLRAYEIRWTIRITAPGQEKTRVIRLDSQPAQQLRMQSERSDPAWAPYAVMMYSAFDDMSARLIRGCGLEPPPAPKVYYFRQVVGAE